MQTLNTTGWRFIPCACLCTRQPGDACLRTWSAVIRALHPPLKLPILFCFSALTVTIHMCSMPLRTVSASFGNLAISCSLVPESHTSAKSVQFRRTSRQPHPCQGGRIQDSKPHSHLPLPTGGKGASPLELPHASGPSKGVQTYFIVLVTVHLSPALGGLKAWPGFPPPPLAPPPAPPRRPSRRGKEDPGIAMASWPPERPFVASTSHSKDIHTSLRDP